MRRLIWEIITDLIAAVSLFASAWLLLLIGYGLGM